MKNSVSSALLALAVGLSAAGLSSTAQATVLLPGTPAVPPDLFGSISGSVLATESAPFSASLNGSTISGSYTQEVIQDSSTGFLDFILQLTNGTGGGNALERFTESTFSPIFGPIDVGFIASGTAGTLTSAAGDIAPGSVDDNVNSVIGFNFLSPGSVPDGGTTDILVIKTDAIAFGQGAISIQDGVTANVAGFAPAPLPAALPLLGSVLGAGFLALRRRRRDAAVSMPGAIA